jgi:hypothetical protein
MRRSSIAVASAVAVGLAGLPVWAQDAQKPEPDAQKVEKRGSMDLRCTPGAGLRVQLVITRLQGDKKVSSLPYTFVLSARPSSTCPPAHVRMRMGVDTPIPVTTFDDSDPKKPKGTSVSYRTVGTNIDCSADDLGDGRFKLSLMVENSSALAGDKAAGDLAQFPLFRKFDTSLEPILRDGQKAETVTSTDPVTGEVVKIDVSLNVAK